ncbi:hypothetical protein GGTG_13449 [Gaeumannomyces tritici R3-111a-1]|uniref:Uncharacterized protein n=1 Tax=Gaeumannomyces tritici (strain R3-111a-1) TaxID=644352 RepID=J3PIW9_GAET3|nr:hypothetical protein GGTG_13449 [Gaeumannomyces tritici R3-111a-1]EJT69052.1 hypothetical protein GGTG_13449 [Gaeumannomyces tritici R3-111a-1]
MGAPAYLPRRSPASTGLLVENEINLREEPVGQYPGLGDAPKGLSGQLEPDHASTVCQSRQARRPSRPASRVDKTTEEKGLTDAINTTSKHRHGDTAAAGTSDSNNNHDGCPGVNTGIGTTTIRAGAL